MEEKDYNEKIAQLEEQYNNMRANYENDYKTRFDGFNEYLKGELFSAMDGVNLSKEENVLSGLQNKDVKIYIKNHPTQVPSVYKDFLEKYSFELLTEPIYPKADVVISYDSTLALEYEEIGAKVYYYSNMRIESILDYLSNLKHSL